MQLTKFSKVKTIHTPGKNLTVADMLSPKIFNQLYINHDTKIIHKDYPNLHDSNPNQRDKTCLPFKLFHAAFNKLHAHGHSGIKIPIKAFNQFYFIPYLNKWMSIFIHDCIECQQNKHINQKIQTASIQTFSENASYFNYRISMETKGPINPPSNQNSYIHVIVDAFSHFVVTVPIKQNNAQNAVNSLLHHWITKFGPPVYLVTDRGSEYIKSEFANLCTTMGIRHSPRTPYAPWTNGLVENQNRNLGTHLRLFLHNTPENWSTQVHMYAYAHNSQPLSEINLSPYEIVFHTIPRIPINFELNSTENQQFIKKFNFEYSDLTDTEYVNLCNILIDNQNCYAKHKNDVGKISTPFRIRTKDNCKLQTQRPSKVPIHYRDRLNKLLLELEKYNIIK